MRDNMKQSTILSILLLFLFTLLLTQCSSDESDASLETENDAEEGTPEACGNGICDAVEKEKGLCSADCDGATSSTTQITGDTGTSPSMQNDGSNEEITIEEGDSDYDVASRDTSGFFTSGQEADILLSGIDFNDAGCALLFNHQNGIATDGTHLALAD